MRGGQLVARITEAISGDSPVLRRKIKRADVTYEELAKWLKAHGHTETAASIANKLARGTFSATFFLAVLVAIEAEVVRLEDI